jgi:hypothetical protein
MPLLDRCYGPHRPRFLPTDRDVRRRSDSLRVTLIGGKHYTASQASLSAALRASAARSAAALTDAPYIVSRDLVPIAPECARLADISKPLQLAAGPNFGPKQPALDKTRRVRLRATHGVWP